ncbi:MAG: DUF362 domain-containing protein [Clostridia bacterium]|nr:DUF362 domain-containing protein [Clostridia bacterium]
MKKVKVIIAVLSVAAAFFAGCTTQSAEVTALPDTEIENIPIYSQPPVSSDPTPSPTEEILKAPNQDYSDIVVLRDTMGEYDDFIKLIEKMNDISIPFYKTASGGKKGIIASDDVVLLEINAQWNQRGGTNTDLVDTVIQAILNHPDGFTGEIIVADNGQAQYGAFGTGGSMDWELNNAQDKDQSIQDVVDRYSSQYKVSTYLWDAITRNKVHEYSEGDTEDGYIVSDEKSATTGFIVSYPKFTTVFGTQISFKYGVWNGEAQAYSKDHFKVINMPVLKSHGGYGITASIKNYMGVPSDKLTKTNAHYSIANGGMGTLMAETTVPSLNILDAIWINPIRGPRTEYYQALNTKIVAVSTDPFALDYWAANEILIPAAIEAGNTNLARMTTEESTIGNVFGHWMRLSLNELINAGYVMRFSSDDVRVFETESKN